MYLVRWTSTLATDQSRSFFREEASRAIIQRKKELVVDTFIPKGSILYDDWEGGVHRRKTSRPTRRSSGGLTIFSLLQKRRLDSYTVAAASTRVYCSSSRATPTPRYEAS